MVYVVINIHLFKIIKKLQSWGGNENDRSPSSYFFVFLLIFMDKASTKVWLEIRF